MYVCYAIVFLVSLVHLLVPAVSLAQGDGTLDGAAVAVAPVVAPTRARAAVTGARTISIVRLPTPTVPALVLVEEVEEEQERWKLKGLELT